MNSGCAPVKLSHALDTTFQLQKMQYETDTTMRRKLLISKEKALSFNTTHIFCGKIFFIENSSYFLFLSKQRLNLISRSACFFVLESYFVVNSLTAKPERVALSKISTSIFGFLKCIIIINNS